VNILTNMHSQPAEGNFCDEHGNALEVPTVQDCSRHMGYANKSDCMTNSYSASKWTRKLTKKPFLHLVDLVIVISFFILPSCGLKLSHQRLSLTFMRDIIQEVGGVPGPQATC
jgi:hypothetical protein